MDHLPAPSARIYLDLDVPLLATLPVSYEEGAFEAYPASRGLELDTSGTVTLATLRDRPAEEALDIIQSWLYFTLLAQVFGNDFQITNFFSSRLDLQGRMIVTSKSLVQLLQGQIKSFYTRILISLDEAEVRRMERLWNMASKQCDIFDKPWPDAGALGSKIILSVRVLHETLLCLPLLRDFEPSISRHLCHSLQPVIQQTLLRGGWCGYQLARMQRGSSCSSTLYLCQLQRLPKRQGWPARCDGSTSCSCFNFDKEVLQNRHDREGCSCSPLQLDASEMSRILHTGGVPLVKCVIRRLQDSFEIVSTEYTIATPERNFVAISHVWADYLAHPEKNAILNCQLRRVLGGIRKVDGERRSSKTHFRRWAAQIGHWLRSFSTTSTHYIWADFLCVPQEQRNIIPPNDTRPCEAQDSEGLTRDMDTAMQLMPAVYTWAQYVLVLDNELDLLTSTSTSLEIMARLAMSGWNSRYWTFQEHMLASNVHFHTSDKYVRSSIVPERLRIERDSKGMGVSFVDIEMYQSWTLIPPLRKPPRSYQKTLPYTRAERSIEERLQQDFNKRLKRVESVYTASAAHVPIAKRENESRIFQQVWNELSQRTTTRSEDACPILATLLDLDPHEIKLLHPALQMKAVFNSQARLPCGLLTAPLLRHNREGEARDERWIPTTLNHDLGHSRCTVRVEYFGLVIDLQSLHSGSQKDFSVLLIQHPWTRNGVLSLVCDGSRFIQVSMTRSFQQSATPIVILLEHFQNPELLDETAVKQQGCAVFEVGHRSNRGIHVSFMSTATWHSYNSEPLYRDQWCEAEDQNLERSHIIIACGKCLDSDISLASWVTRDSAIHSWPKLKQRRDLLYRTLAKWSRIVITILLPITQFIFHALFSMFFVFGFSSRYDHKLAVLGVLYILFLVATRWCVRLVPRAISHVVLHSYVPSGMDDSAWPFWRRLDEALPSLDRGVLDSGLPSLVTLKMYVITAKVISGLLGYTHR